jgi:peptidyl-prolyl cis-trans isomerase SurA
LGANVVEGTMEMTGQPNVFIAIRRLVAAAMLGFAAALAATGATAQHVVVIVNGDPITALDIEQRAKLIQLSTHKAPPRQEVLDELINEKLKVREARRWGLEIGDAEVDQSLATMAQRMRYTPEQLVEGLAKAGIHVNTLKARIRADLAWQQLVRGRFQAALQIGEKDIVAASEPKVEEAVGFDYTLRPILFFAPSGSSPSFIDGRKREAEALRARFPGCEEGVPFVRALRDVVVREPVVRNSAGLPPELRKVLEATEVGKLTPPEVTKLGVEMFAVCGKKESSADNSPSKRRARESLYAQRFEKRSNDYLKELRRGAMLEYK